MGLETIKKYLLIGVGTISLVIGFVGVVVPVLPTTPFLLLSAVCYMKSSKRLYAWLIKHRVLGVYLYSYLNYRAVPSKSKISTFVFLWGMLGISMALVDSIHLHIFLIVVGILVSLHITMLKSLTPEQLQEVKLRVANLTEKP